MTMLQKEQGAQLKKPLALELIKSVVITQSYLSQEYGHGKKSSVSIWTAEGLSQFRGNMNLGSIIFSLNYGIYLGSFLVGSQLAQK